MGFKLKPDMYPATTAPMLHLYISHFFTTSCTIHVRTDFQGLSSFRQAHGDSVQTNNIPKINDIDLQENQTVCDCDLPKKVVLHDLRGNQSPLFEFNILYICFLLYYYLSIMFVYTWELLWFVLLCLDIHFENNRKKKVQ